jgi:hypothetical protein
MKRFSLFVLAFFIGMGVVSPSVAQDQQESENSLLPEIDPQDIEIRSQFKARFPGLRRQPILGFDPTPRVYQIDPNRTPFMETQEEVVANLPVSELSRPDPPLYTPYHYSSEINAFGRLGMGSYFSPEAKFWGVTRLNSKSYFGGDLDYSSSDGHLDSQESSFRFLNANGEFVTKMSEKSRLGLNGGFESSFNNMFDIALFSNIPDAARKEYDGFHLGADFEQFKNTITGWKATANIRYFNAALSNAGNLSGKSEERVFNGSVAKRWPGSNVSETFTVKLGTKGGNFENNALSADWLTAQGGVVYERLFNYQTNVSVDASVYYGTDNFGDNFYIGPEITVQHPLLDILTLTVKGSAKPYVKTIEQLHSQNRFLNVDNILRHSYRIRGSAEASLKYANQGVLNLGVQYEDISDYPIFQRDPSQTLIGAPYLFYGTNYQDIYRAKAYVSVTQQLLSDRLRFNGKVYLQSPQIKNGGRIPFEEKIGVNSGISVRPFDKLTFEAWADYVGSRRTLQTDDKLDGFLLLGGQVDVQITERFGAYVKFVNILNQDYQVWQGYTERPFQTFGGLTVKL